MTEDELIERLADVMHQSWARYVSYLLSKCEREAVIGNPRDLVIDGDYVAALQRQIETPYAELSDAKKQLDREEVAHLLPIIREYAESQLADIALEGKAPGEGVAFVIWPVQNDKPRPFRDPFEQEYTPQPVQLWQTCPKCNGQKHVATPPWVDGDIRTFYAGGTNSYPCPVCEGRGLVPMPTAGGAR